MFLFFRVTDSKRPRLSIRYSADSYHGLTAHRLGLRWCGYDG